MGNAAYYLRFKVLVRVMPVKRSSGEPVESWPDTDDAPRFDARPLSLNAGEQIRQGVKEGTEFVKIEIRGENVRIDQTCRLKNLVTGQVYRVSAPPTRKRKTTELALESVQPDAATS